MNMTIVIVSRHAAEMVLLMVALSSLALLLALPGDRLVAGHNNISEQGTGQPPQEEIPETVEAVIDQSVELDQEMLGTITKDLGEHLEETMSKEIERFVREMEEESAHIKQRPSRETSSKKEDELTGEQLEKLKEANRAASRDIKERIELVGDSSGKLPQMSLGFTPNSLLAAASNRLSSASSYIGSKMSSLSSTVARRIPDKLKRFFQWPNFMSFKVRFHKTYGSLREELYRCMVFLKNMIDVRMQHIRFILHRATHLLGQTQYSDMTEKEFAERVGNAELMNDKPEQMDELAHRKWMAKLEALEAKKVTIHGDKIVEDEPRKKKRTINNHERSKRSVIVVDENEDELEATEDGDFSDMAAFGSPPSFATFQGEDQDAMEDVDDQEVYDMVNQYANAVDLADADDALKDMDAALEQAKFEPIDLRKTGCLVRAENQGNCGNCYALAATVLASYHECKERTGVKIPTRYNAQFVSECGRYLEPADRKPRFIRGCDGGRASKAVEFTRLAGITYFYDYYLLRSKWKKEQASKAKEAEVEPDEEEEIWQWGGSRGGGGSQNLAAEKPKEKPEDNCLYPRPKDITDPKQWPTKNPIVKFSFLEKMRIETLKIHEINLHLRTIGPVLVNILCWPNFRQLKAGIFSELVEPTHDGHSMLIVGHERDDNNNEYYIVLNSFGVDWGQRGYLYITAEALDYYAFMYLGTMAEVEDEPEANNEVDNNKSAAAAEAKTN